ncbi:MAG: hypothetical protein EZS28_047586 [Streblomastix strix]|uniref:Uncharacterized protein n=1 Tax=Streblomastix strix TaxID=222440 RepID=A0A5J4TFA0_9EUKA|nr:MAG: hypothetical protein EZS28_047586 [Streblomastix strix]
MVSWNWMMMYNKLNKNCCLKMLKLVDDEDEEELYPDYDEEELQLEQGTEQDEQELLLEYELQLEVGNERPYQLRPSIAPLLVYLTFNPLIEDAPLLVYLTFNPLIEDGQLELVDVDVEDGEKDILTVFNCIPSLFSLYRISGCPSFLRCAEVVVGVGIGAEVEADVAVEVVSD